MVKNLPFKEAISVYGPECPDRIKFFAAGGASIVTLLEIKKFYRTETSSRAWSEFERDYNLYAEALAEAEAEAEAGAEAEAEALAEAEVAKEDIDSE